MLVLTCIVIVIWSYTVRVTSVVKYETRLSTRLYTVWLACFRIFVDDGGDDGGKQRAIEAPAIEYSCVTQRMSYLIRTK